MKTKFFVVSHKAVSLDLPKGYSIIYVGKNQPKPLPKGDFSDRSGQNITKKNPFFCELTAYYWIWKNYAGHGAIGTSHYRRFFCDPHHPRRKQPISAERAGQLLEKYDILVPRSLRFGSTVSEQYAACHNIADLVLCGKVIREKYGNKYFEAFQKTIAKTSLHPYNMFVMSRKNYDAYMEWLFDVLFELEKRIDISSYDVYNQRVFGFLSERLLSVWISVNGLKVKTLPVYNTEQPDPTFFNRLKARFSSGR